MKFLLILFWLISPCVCMVHASSLTHAYKFRVYLSDKGNSEFSLDNPGEFLSHRALERKKRQGVEVDEADLPIARDYFALVGQAGGEVVSHSKWFATLVVQTGDSLGIVPIEALSFVDSVKYIWQGVDRPYREGMRPRLQENNTQAWEHIYENRYGITGDQFYMHNAHLLGNAGFRGKNIEVGVIDAGFTNFDVIPWFDTVNLLGYEDFVPGGSIFTSSDHGTKVVSTMAVNRPGYMMGSAPDASYWLFRSEDVNTEFPVEEDYWVRAIEYADSVGVDVINTSLGYNQFDDKTLNYTHQDLTGGVSFMSLAANKAFKKGMIVVVSAGNEGNKEWQKSTPPADAEHVLAIGAAGTDSVIASFSSRGNLADGRVKPDLISVGKGTVTIGQNGLIGFTNGTSLSSPFMAGLIASLWSVNPHLHRAELVDIVKRSSDRYLSPDTVYGHGIPDFHKAMVEVLATLPVHAKRVVDQDWSIIPDDDHRYWAKPMEPRFRGDAYRVRLLDEQGVLLSEHTIENNQSVAIPLSKEVRKKNRYLHFVVEEPFTMHTYRVKL